VTVVLALEKLVDDVAAVFAQDGATWAAPLYVFTGTSVPTVDAASIPTLTRIVRVRVTIAGTVGTTGIEYEYSLDDGATWVGPVALGTASLIAVPGSGVTFHLSAGTLELADEVSVATTVTDMPPQVFGWREPDKRTGARRIVWVPGNEGDIGEVAAPKYPGRIEGRPLATVHELFTVYLEAQDPSDAENERKQYHATRVLFDAWLRAVYLSAVGTFRLVDVRWVADKKVRRFGAAIRVVGYVEAMVPDAPLEQVPADARVVAKVDELDVEEVDEFQAA
jgi:hypothetical protein